MNVSDMIEEMASWLSRAGGPVAASSRPACHRIEADVRTERAVHRVALEGRVDAHGRVRERFWCDGIRLQRHELLRLTCPEAECPQSRALREQWQAFLQRRGRAGGRVGALRAGGPGHPTGMPLLTEHPLQVAGRSCSARPATFRCFTACPNRAHPPLWLDKRGWDVFENGVCLGGGLAPSTTRDGVTTTQPRLPTLQAAEAYVLARTLEVSALLALLPDRR
jgi:hypothetical protein